MAAQDESIFREVNEAIRHDRMMALWQTYRVPLLAFVAVLVLATAAGNVWSGYQSKRAGESMQQLLIAQEQYQAGDYKTAADSFGIAADVALKGELRDLAELWESRALEQAGKPKAALVQLERVANAPEGKDLIWRDLACLRLASLAVDKAQSCLEAGPSPLADERSLVRASLLWEKGENAKAAALLKMLVGNPESSEAVRARAQHYLSAVPGSDAHSS